MTKALASAAGSQVSKIIKAPRHKVYQAFLDPQAVASWLVPDNMRATVHTFEPREGGTFRVSLTYRDPVDSQHGKTSLATDTYHGRFAKLVDDKLIEEVIEFETHQPEFIGEMRMTVKFADVDGGTEVSLIYENVPSGIHPEDNEAGSRQSLRNLAALVE